MIVYCVSVNVKKENVQDFIDATIDNHKGTIQEPGNLRFDVLRCNDDPSKFMLYEVYDSENAVAEHKKTPHYLKWRETVAGWMAEPRKGVSYSVICPTDKSLW